MNFLISNVDNVEMDKSIFYLKNALRSVNSFLRYAHWWNH